MNERNQNFFRVVFLNDMLGVLCKKVLSISVVDILLLTIPTVQMYHSYDINGQKELTSKVIQVRFDVRPTCYLNFKNEYGIYDSEWQLK